MEAITIKDLAKYIPHGLQAKVFRLEEVFDVVSITDSKIKGVGISSHENLFELNDIRPIFRPLSQLIQEIEHNGEKFVPIIELAKMFINEEVFAFMWM